jgi:hypothetical protein
MTCHATWAKVQVARRTSGFSQRSLSTPDRSERNGKLGKAGGFDLFSCEWPGYNPDMMYCRITLRKHQRRQGKMEDPHTCPLPSPSLCFFSISVGVCRHPAFCPHHTHTDRCMIQSASWSDRICFFLHEALATRSIALAFPSRGPLFCQLREVRFFSPPSHMPGQYVTPTRKASCMHICVMLYYIGIEGWGQGPSESGREIDRGWRSRFPSFPLRLAPAMYTTPARMVNPVVSQSQMTLSNQRSHGISCRALWQCPLTSYF